MFLPIISPRRVVPLARDEAGGLVKVGVGNLNFDPDQVACFPVRLTGSPVLFLCQSKTHKVLGSKKINYLRYEVTDRSGYQIEAEGSSGRSCFDRGPGRHVVEKVPMYLYTHMRLLGYNLRHPPQLHSPLFSSSSTHIISLLSPSLSSIPD